MIGFMTTTAIIAVITSLYVSAGDAARVSVARMLPERLGTTNYVLIAFLV
jgi:hypothetical protein